MGTSTDAVLAYGYDLGSADEWKIHEAGKYGEIDTSEVTWYSDESGDDGFTEQAERHLLTSIGFTETWGDRSDGGYFDRKKEAKARVGVEFEAYCSGDYSMYVLAAKVITVHRGHSKILDLPSLMAEPTEHGWDDKLRQACEVLGITPKQESPGWVLVSYWG